MASTQELLALTLCMLLSYKALALDKYIEDTGEDFFDSTFRLFS